MNHYQSALEATEAHLRVLQANGVRFLNIRAETLFALQQSVPQPPPQSNAENARKTETLLAVQPLVSEASQPGTPQLQRSSAGPEQDERVEVHPIPPALQHSLGVGQKAAAMAALRERTMACVKCPHLVKSRHTVGFGTGDLNARLMFVGEAPGADEDAQGEPFVGAAGHTLTRIIKAMGFTRETVYIANILKCRPDTPGQSAGNRKPTSDEMATCIPYLHEQIDLIRPKVIVALGATAVEGLLGKTIGITKLRGGWKTYRGTPLMPTYHPAYLLRNQAMSEKRKVWEDMLAVMEKLGMPISEKQRNFFLKV